ncbi:MAG: pantetheine-phosphate adenylyltransferase [Mogibacterium sp.]|nr:pantetheine-phosphate adenylyltransferase [Mogibacterium sp.]
MERKALYAGSFDPVTNGHLNIIERAAKMYDSLTVAIAINPNKTEFFTVEERVEITREVTKHIPNVNVITFDGLLADHVNNNCYTAYIRGLRATLDFENELQMAQINAHLFTGETETIFLMTDPKYSYISSSIIKEVVSLGGNVEGLIPEYVEKRIKEKLSE